MRERGLIEMLRILTNHIGYDSADTKTAVFQGEKDIVPTSFTVYDYKTDEAVLSGAPVEVGEVDRWNKGYYWTISFSELKKKGTYYISLQTNEKEYKSFPFDIADNLLEYKTLSSAAYYFKAQRPTGEFEAAERNLPFAGDREGRFDVRGGWYDATGDYSVHLSHLSHTTYFNPQQAAFSAYGFFKFHDLLEESGNVEYSMLKRRLHDEAMYGADFLMRFRAPSGTFFRSKRRASAFEPVNTTRAIAYEYRHAKVKNNGGVTEGLDVINDTNYEVAFRSGGGYAIATLAYAARTNYPSDFSNKEYIDAAISAYNYLYENNGLYTADGGWNLIDEYCALDALIEIYKTTREYDYLLRAEDMAKRILNKYIAVDDTMGYLSVDGTSRPFFHAADEGMPVVNLLNFCAIEPDHELKAEVLDICEKLMRHQLKITNEVNNPFGYARMHCQGGDGRIKTQFFYPHDVETAPWWQGENARIASLATAARYMSYHTADEDFKSALRKYADDQINWVLGLNPYDSCMLQGMGRNNNAYFFNLRYDFIHCPGGIVNGITGGLDDENSIEFITEPVGDIVDNWRWAEQWIPHCTWYMYALSMKKR